MDDLNWLEEIKDDAYFITKQRLEADLRKRGTSKKSDGPSRVEQAQEAEVVDEPAKKTTAKKTTAK